MISLYGSQIPPMFIYLCHLCKCSKPLWPLLFIQLGFCSKKRISRGKLCVIWCQSLLGCNCCSWGGQIWCLGCYTKIGCCCFRGYKVGCDPDLAYFKGYQFKPHYLTLLCCSLFTVFVSPLDLGWVPCFERFIQFSSFLVYFQDEFVLCFCPEPCCFLPCLEDLCPVYECCWGY